MNRRVGVPIRFVSICRDWTLSLNISPRTVHRSVLADDLSSHAFDRSDHAGGNAAVEISDYNNYR